MQELKEYDILVIGGGMVGAAVGLGAAKQGYKVFILEKNKLPGFDAMSDYDIRISAISLGSVSLLSELGGWQHTKNMRHHPYNCLETWEEYDSKISFHANELNLPELGYMVENNLVQLGLWEEIKNNPNIDFQLEGNLRQAQNLGDKWRFDLDDYSVIGKLVMAADGANSRMRDIAGIKLLSLPYKQECMLITVELDNQAGFTTWQEFHPSGPRSLLPLSKNHACLVWYDSRQKITELMNMHKTKLAEQIISNFPSRIGESLEVKDRASFELIRRHAKGYVKNGVVLLGDAAHTINPLAGQGVNIGFKDVKEILQTLEYARDNNIDIRDEKLLRKFEFKRMPDNWAMQTGMDVFYHGFNNSFTPLKFIRNISFKAGNRMNLTKKQILKYAIGI